MRFDEEVSASDRALEAQAKKAAGDVSPADADAGHKLVSDALAAKGGDLAKVKSLSMSGKGTMTMRGQTLPITVEEFQIPSESARQDINVGPMQMRQIFADGKAWMKQGDKVVELPAPVADQMKKGLLRDPNFILLYARQGKLKARALAPISDGGLKYDAVELIGPDGDKTQVLLDPKTHLIARLDFQEEGKPTQQSLSDYRKEGGISMPHKIQQTGEGGEDGGHLRQSDAQSQPPGGDVQAVRIFETPGRRGASRRRGQETGNRQPATGNFASPVACCLFWLAPWRPGD